MKTAWEIDNMPSFEPLSGDIETDVCVIGGGLAGVWCAYLLSKEGKKIAVLEKDEYGQAATMYTTAFITHAVDTSLTELSSIFGEAQAKLVWQSHKEAIDEIERAVTEEKIDCEFKRLPIHLYAGKQEDLKNLREEGEIARKLGFEAQMVDQLGGFKNWGALEIPNQAKYHPIKFFVGLIEAAKKNGVTFFEKSEAREIDEDPSGVTVVTKEGKHVKAKDVIVATYKPFNNPRPTKFMKGMYISYVYELELPKGALPEGMYLDQENPYHYTRVDDLGNKLRMIVGGEDHRAELKFLEEKSFDALKDYIRKTFPNLEYKIRHRWPGEILEPTDGLALIGKYTQHQYVATAFSGNGMTYSALTGRLLTDLIVNRTSPYRVVYEPGRPLHTKAFLTKFKDYAQEFWGGAVKNLFR